MYMLRMQVVVSYLPALLYDKCQKPIFEQVMFMPIKNIEFTVDNEPVSLRVEGDFAWGNNEVLLSLDKDLTAGNTWAGEGYTITQFLPQDEFEVFLEQLKHLFEALCQKIDVPVSADNNMENYHLWISDEAHQKVIEALQHGLNSDTLPGGREKMEAMVSKIIGKPITNINTIKGPFYSLRVVRPGRNDFNPPHRDVYLDRLRNGINIYVSLWGCSAKSGLALIPGSHLWAESDIERTSAGNTAVNGVKYSVPCVTDSKHGLNFVRPCVQTNKLMVFSPYLVHGVGNNNSEHTRFSIEMRFWTE